MDGLMSYSADRRIPVSAQKAYGEDCGDRLCRKRGKPDAIPAKQQNEERKRGNERQIATQHREEERLSRAEYGGEIAGCRDVYPGKGKGENVNPQHMDRRGDQFCPCTAVRGTDVKVNQNGCARLK